MGGTDGDEKRVGIGSGGGRLGEGGEWRERREQKIVVRGVRFVSRCVMVKHKKGSAALWYFGSSSRHYVSQLLYYLAYSSREQNERLWFHPSYSALYCTCSSSRYGRIKEHISSSSRRAFLSESALAFTSVLGLPAASNARYILNEETGEYDEVTDEDWQTTWNKRVEKARNMSTDEVFLAAQGAGNVNLKDGQESEASKKRRALAGCRNGGMREKSGMNDEKQCTARVLGGDFQFMIDSL